jgi:hypothetical protein
MKRLLLLVLIAFTLNVSAQQYLFSGRITDQKNMPVSFASVYIKNSAYGATANENGNYQFKLSPGTYDIIYRMVGYVEKIERISISSQNEVHDVQLQEELFQLRDAAVKTTADVNDPAMEIMRQVIAKRDFYLNEVKSYSCVVYIKGVQKLTSAPRSLLTSGVAKTLDLDANGRGILYQSESLSTFSFSQPNKMKEELIASKVAGLSPTFSYNKASDLQVNFYNNLFRVNGLSSHGFVSPAAADAFKHYTYKLVGTSVENGRKIDKIQVIPINDRGPVFRGNIYILEDSWRIYSVDLMLTKKDNNLNLVDTLEVSQQYIPLNDNIWEPVSVQYAYKGDVLGFKFAGYYLGIYNNYKIDTVFRKGYFNGEVLHVDTASNTKSQAYWENTRPVPLTMQEARDYHKKDSVFALKRSDRYLDSMQHVKNEIHILPYLIFGYSASNRTGKDSLYLFPFIQTLYYNTVEGVGINLKVRLSRTYADNRSFSITPNIRYGFSNKLFSANVHTEYLYDPEHLGKFFGGFGRDILDLNNVGTRSLYFNTLSTLLSEQNFVKYYRSEFGTAGYQREISNGVLWTSGLTYENRTQLFNTSFAHFSSPKGKRLTSNNPLAPDAPADDHSILFPQNQAFVFSTSFRFTFDQQYITRPTGKVYLPSRYPVLTVNYRKAISGVFGSDANYDFASLDVSQAHMRIGLLGYSAFKVTAGDFLNRSKLYFMDYNHFLGNQGTTFDPTYIGSFHFLPFYTFSTNNTFLEAHYQHNFSGTLLGKVSFLRKLKLEEIIGANYLTEKANPNYTEFYVGLQRLIFRVDYGVSYAGNKKYLQGFRIFYGIR